jgi:hypothetical protein
MKAHGRQRRAAAAWMLALPWLPAAAQMAAAALPQLRVGDRWRYRTNDGYSGVLLGEAETSVLAVLDDGYLIAIENARGRTERRISRELNPQQVGEGLPADTGELRFPLSVGARWKSLASFAKTNGSRGVIRLEHEVVEAGRVRVPAGEFDACRITGSGFWDLTAFPIEKAQGDFSGKSERVVWYAPAVQRWVVVEMRTSAKGHRADWTRSELVTYERGP